MISSNSIMYFTYKGIKVFYEESGQGSPLLLLHGWGCTHSIFEAFVPDLAKTHRVIALDFPGFGASGEPKEVWGVNEYCMILEALCDGISVVRPSIIAHSFGGRVAIVFASRNPVNRLLFVDVAGIKPRRDLSYYGKVYSYKLTKWFLLKVLRNEDAFARLSAGRGSSDYANASPMMKAILSKTVNQDLRRLLPKINAPVILFWGEEDTATPIEDARLMSRLLPDAGLITVKGGGHFSFLDNPSLFRSVAKNFLK